MSELNRRGFMTLSVAALTVATLARTKPVLASNATSIKVYKSPLCGCCGAWVENLSEFGFEIDVTNMEDVTPVKRHFGVGEDLYSCHTALFDGYVIEGHVPAADIERLILERPKAIGLAVPGMPIGSPGMEQGDEKEPFDVVLFDKTSRWVFSSYR